MTAGPIACAACGAKLRSDRKRCLRCGAPITLAASGIAPAPLTKMLVGAAALAVAALAIIMLRGVPMPLRASMPQAIGAIAATPRAAVANAAAASAVQTNLSGAAAAEVVLSANRDATAAYARGDVTAAIDNLTRAVDADPQNAMALNNLAQVLVRAGRVQDAIPYFDRAITLSDSTWAYHFNRARAYEALKQWDAAIADYRDATQLFPYDYATQFNLAKTLEASGNLPDAIDTYQHAIDLAPGQPDFHLAKAHALELAGRAKDAATAYRAYLDLQPDGRDADKIKARIAQLEGTPGAGAAPESAPAAAASTLAADRRVP